MFDTEFKNTAKSAQCSLSEDEIAAQIDNSPYLKFPSSFLRSRYPAFWKENIALTPQQAGDILTAGLSGNDTTIEITKGKESFSLNIAGIIHALNGNEVGFEKMMTGPKIQETGRDLDLRTGTMHPGFIKAERMQGGRTFLRNQFELGYALGCNNLRINTANIGSWLWNRGFNVESVQPEYMKHLRGVYDKFKGRIDDEGVKQAIETALENEDMQTLAEIDYDILDRMPDINTYAHFSTDFSSTIAREGRLSISKAMMIKHSDGNWTGTADLKNPRDCARLGQCLGGWNNPELKARAAQYEKTAAASPEKRPSMA